MVVNRWRNWHSVRLTILTVCLVTASAAAAAGGSPGQEAGEAPAIVSCQIVSSRRMPYPMVEYVYACMLQNGPTASKGLRARATSGDQKVTILDDDLTFPEARPFEWVRSLDTFSVRFHRAYPPSRQWLRWRIWRWPLYSVVPVLFSPIDWDVNSLEVQEEAAALRSAMVDIQEFYRVALGGATFVLNELEVVQGRNPKEAYGIRWNGRNIYTDGIDIVGNVEAAVVAELHERGFPTPPAQNEDGYVVLMFVKGAGGWAGGRELGAGDGGWAILGDWAIDSIQGTVPEGAYWWSGRRLQVGAAAHELGHTFGLPHPDFYSGNWSTTIMGEWWNYPNLGFNQWELQYLGWKEPFFPGWRAPAWPVDDVDYPR